MRAALLLISLLAGSSGPLRAEPPAEDSRACGWAEDLDVGPRQAQLVEKRRAKCAELEPYKPGFIDRQILAFEKAERPPITQINLFGLYPRIQTIDHRSQTAGGVRLWRPGVGGSALDLAGNAFWSLQGFRYYDAQAGVIPHRGRSLPPFAIEGHDVFDWRTCAATTTGVTCSTEPLPTAGRRSSTSSEAGRARDGRTRPASARGTPSWKRSRDIAS